MAVTVLIVDDHALVREALRDSLEKEADIRVVGEAGDAAGALEATRALKPEIVVLDIGLPDINGIEAAAWLKERSGADPKIVALSAYSDRRFVAEMLRAGASAYVTKSSAGAELPRAIRAVAAGQTYVCPEVAGTLVSAMRGEEDKDDSPRLSRREREILCMIAGGTRSPAIATQLHISLGTVEVHRRNIMRKLNLRTVAELTRYAVREGMVVA